MKPRTAQPRSSGPLDRVTLTSATIASLLMALITSALGAGFLAALIAAGVAPAITAFLVHPGPHRNRRISAVLALVLALRGGRAALASERVDADREARIVAPALNAVVAFVIAIVVLMLFELVLWPDRPSPTAASAHDRRPVERSRGDTLAEVARHKRAAPGHRRPSRTPTPAPIRDSVAPELWLPPGVTSPARNAHGAVVTYRARAVDRADGIVAVACTPASGSRFDVGRTTVRCRASDRAGNVARGRFPVLVTAPADAAPPRLRLPTSVTRATINPAGIVVRYRVAAVDERDGPVPLACTPPSGSRFRIGTTVVRCRASDRAGNVATDAFSVVVRAAVAPDHDPVPSPTTDPTPTPTPEPDPDPADRLPPVLKLPAGLLVPTRDDAGTRVRYEATAIDAEDGPVAVTCAPRSGSFFAVGATTVTCAARDRAGNVATGEFAVDVVYQPGEASPLMGNEPAASAPVVPDQ